MEDILNFTYKNSYVIYARKSTDDADNQKNSIAYQRAEGIRLVKQDRLLVAPVDVEGLCKAGIISERHTAFKEDEFFNITKEGKIEYQIERPKFARLVHYLQEGYFKGAIFLCWDRASRNDNDDNILKKLIAKGIDIRFVDANYENNSSGKMHMDMDGIMAKSHSRITSEKVRSTTRKLRSEGIETEIYKILCQLTRTVKHAAEIDCKLDTSLKVLETQKKQIMEENDRKTRKLKENLAYLKDNKLSLLQTGVYTYGDFMAEEAKISSELEVLVRNQASDASALEVLQDTEKLSELLEKVVFYYLLAEKDEKKQIISKVFSELFVTENELRYKAKNGLVPFELPYILTCAPKIGISELMDNFESFKTCVEEMEQLLHK